MVDQLARNTKFEGSNPVKGNKNSKERDKILLSSS